MIINSVLRVQQSLRQAYIEMIYKVHTDSSARIGTGDPNSAQGKGLGRMSVGSGLGWSQDNSSASLLESTTDIS